jgi:antitoxin FitA
MAQLNTLEIPDALYTQIQGLALSQNRSVNDQVVQLLQLALPAESPSQVQAKILAEIHSSQWTPTQEIPDSVTLLREMRGYDI